MAHKHSVYDSDLHFAINPITRTITNMSSQKTTLIQYDHNSERFTFELPRYVEGHDMSVCNSIEIHYLNVEAATKMKSEGVYAVTDLQLSPEDENVVICSWLISQNATRLVGSLNFLVRFACVTDGTIDYVWNTAIFTGIAVSSGIYNGDVIVEQYADILEQWKNEFGNSGLPDRYTYHNLSSNPDIYNNTHNEFTYDSDFTSGSLALFIKIFNDGYGVLSDASKSSAATITVNVVDGLTIEFYLHDKNGNWNESMEIVWSGAEPTFTPGYTYFLSFVPLSDTRILGAWSEVPTV